MFKKYPLLVGFRYAAAKRSNQLVSFISSVSMLGMAIGVALLILVLSVMNGFDREMHNRILGLVPHITVTTYGPDQDWQAISQVISTYPDVTAVAPYTQLNAMMLRGANVEGVMVYGVNPEAERSVSIINQYVSDAHLNALAGVSNGIILGEPLAVRLGVKAGDTINLMVPQESASGRISPKFARLHVLAAFKTGTEIDQSMALMGIEKTRSLLPPDSRAEGLRIKVADTFQAARAAWEINQNLPYGYSARDWTSTHGNLYSAIQLSKRLVGLMLFTIIAVAAFNVVSALVMIVTDKRGDIAILRTAGASQSEIMAIFMVQGTVIAVFGTVLGCVIGVVLALGITDIVAMLERLLNIQFLNTDVYPIDYLPSDLRGLDVARVSLTAFALSIAATIYPAWRAARVQPAEALRYH